MWMLLGTALIVAAVLIRFWIIKKDTGPVSKNPTYVCPECGDKNCNCYLEKEKQ